MPSATTAADWRFLSKSRRPISGATFPNRCRNASSSLLARYSPTRPRRTINPVDSANKLRKRHVWSSTQTHSTETGSPRFEVSRQGTLLNSFAVIFCVILFLHLAVSLAACCPEVVHHIYRCPGMAQELL